MLSRAECLKEFGSDYLIEKRIKKGELFKISKGIYSTKEHVPDLAVLSYKYPEAVVTMKSAFYYYGLSNVIPDEYDFATTRNATKIRDKKVKQYFVSEDFFVEGVQVVEYKGYNIRMYSKERMLVELVRYKSKLSYDYYKEVLLNYRRMLSQLNIQEIQDIALVAPKSNRIIETLQAEVF